MAEVNYEREKLLILKAEYKGLTGKYWHKSQPTLQSLIEIPQIPKHVVIELRDQL